MDRSRLYKNTGKNNEVRDSRFLYMVLGTKTKENRPIG